MGIAIAATISGSAIAADLNPAAIAYTLADKIEWKQTSPGSQQAILASDPATPDLYVVMVKWLPDNMSRPHFHPTAKSRPPRRVWIRSSQGPTSP